VKRGMKGSPSMYNAVKKRTLAAINITTTIKVSPVWSNKIVIFIGLEGVKKKSHSKIMDFSWNLINKRRGIIINKRIKRVEPAFTGCHIIKAEGKFYPRNEPKSICFAFLPIIGRGKSGLSFLRIAIYSYYIKNFVLALEIKFNRELINYKSWSWGDNNNSNN